MPFVQHLRKRSILGIYVPELLLIVFGVAAFLLYRNFHLHWKAPLWLYWERLASSLICYLVALGVALLVVRLMHIREGRTAKRMVPHHVTWRIFKEHFLTRKQLMFDFRMVSAIAIMFVLFIHLKHLIPWIHPGVYDEPLSRFEENLFRGVPTVILQDALGLQIAPFLSGIYTAFFGYLAAVLTFFILQRHRDWTVEFLTSFFFLWLGGLLIVYVLPTWGPCFFDPSTIAMLPETDMSRVQLDLWRHKEILELRPNAPNAMYLISGLPSLHLAATALGSIYLRRFGMKWALLSWGFTALTAVSTVYFGWHYVMDDVVGILWAFLVKRISDRYFLPYIVYVKDVPGQASPPVQRHA